MNNLKISKNQKKTQQNQDTDPKKIENSQQTNKITKRDCINHMEKNTQKTCSTFPAFEVRNEMFNRNLDIDLKKQSIEKKQFVSPVRFYSPVIKQNRDRNIEKINFNSLRPSPKLMQLEYGCIF